MPATPTYATAANVRTYTNDTDLADSGQFNDAALNAKIIAAEEYIDSHAGYWDRYDQYQARVFPRSHDIAENGTTFIPNAIMLATIAQVEFMFQNMPDMDHGVEIDVKPTAVSLSPRAKQLMKGYSRKTGRVTFPQDGVPGVASFQ